MQNYNNLKVSDEIPDDLSKNSDAAHINDSEMHTINLVNEFDEIDDYGTLNTNENNKLTSNNNELIKPKISLFGKFLVFFHCYGA